MTDHAASIRKSVLLLHYIVPAIIYSIFFAFLSFSNTASNIVYAFLLVAAYVTLLLTNKNRYLCHVFTRDGVLHLQYFTVFLVKKTVQIPVADVGNLTLSPVSAPKMCTLQVKQQNKWTRYLILQKTLHTAVTHELHAAKADA
jgi:hypothetical protein